MVGARATPSEQREVAEIARALGEAGLRATMGGAAGASPDASADAVRLVWAEELDGFVGAIASRERERSLERTIVVNEARDRVLDLLQERRLLGAIEYEDVAEWFAAEPPRLFVRKDVVDGHGEPVGGPGRESADYALWSDPDAGSLASALGHYIGLWRELDDELVIPADEARARGLPPVELRLKLGGTTLFRMPAERSPDYYVVLGGAPGTRLGFSALPAPDAGESLELNARRILHRPSGPPLEVAGGLERIDLAGAEREAICLYSDWLRFRTARCAVRIEHASGVLVALFTAGFPLDRTPSCEEVLSVPALRRIARSLRVIDAEARR